MNLRNATITGFFSLPSPSLAEHNPTAYNLAMAAAPAGAGTCANCGMGIRHHVVARLADGRQVFIGSDCAMRVGDERVRSCVRSRMTEEQRATREAERDEKHRAYLQEVAEQNARDARRAEFYADILEWLEAKPYDWEGTDERWAQFVKDGSTFHTSLARQLRSYGLSSRQAECIAKSWHGRRSKKNAEEFDALCDKLTLDRKELDQPLLAELSANE